MKALLVLLAVGLLIYAVIDCSKAEDQDIPSGIPRAAWIALMIVIPILGPIFWIVASRTEPTPRGGPRPPQGTGKTGPRTPVGPDDDPDFLRGL